MLRAALEASPGSPASWPDKLFAATHMAILCERIREDHRRGAGRRSTKRTEPLKAAKRLLLVEAQKIIDDHPDWGLQAVAQEIVGKDPRGRKWWTIYQNVLLPAERSGELKLP